MKIPALPAPPPDALRLRLLGQLELARPDGTSLGSVLTQPKRLALLAFLAIGCDGGFVRRDVLLNIFWPEFDQERARAALRKALYFLRQSLGENVITARGDDELGVDGDRLWCDAVAFQAAITAGRLEDGIELYRGDLFHGFFVSGEADFEAWAEVERTRLRLLAARAAGELSDQAETAGDLERAVRHAHRALELDPASEPSFRRLAGLLYRHGDRTGLAHAYEQWRTRLSETYGIEPAVETQQMVSAALAARSHHTHATPDAAPNADLTRSRPRPRPFMHRWLAPTVALVGVAAVLAAAVFGRDRSSLERKRVFVASLQNDTGDPSLDPVGRIAADWIAHGLMEVGAIEVVSASSALLPHSVRRITDVRALAEDHGAGTAIAGRYYREGGLLHMQAQVMDVAGGRLLHTIVPIPVAPDSITAGADQLRQRIAAAMAAHFDWPAEWTELTKRPRPPTYAAYSEFVAGWDQFSRVLFSGAQVNVRAAEHFERAAALDTTFQLPLLHAVLAYNKLNQLDRADSILRLVEQKITALTPYEKLLLEHFKALQSSNIEQALRSGRRLNELAPNSLLTGYTFLAVSANRPREAVAAHRNFRRDRGLLKDEDLYWRWFTVARHMLGDYRNELQDARQERSRQPELMGPLFVEARALAGLGRTGEIERLLEETHRLPRQEFTPGAVMLHTAAELRAHGHHEVAARVLAKALAWHDTRPPDVRARLRETLARTLYEAGRYQEARALFEELMAEQPMNLMRLGFLGASAARLKDDAEAERILALLEKRRDRNALHILWQAHIAAVQDKPAEAIALLERAFAEGLRYDLWLHTHKDLDSLRRHKAFRELVKPKG